MNTVLHRLASPLLQWSRHAAALRRQQAEARALMAMGQHELNDLGVGRSELQSLMRNAG
ncbi:MAG: DUF1127 domain-containing protein [Variovorax sp.]|nr:MAG: DUF1127 domain-containing protein [Variovorax sp.]